MIRTAQATVDPRASRLHRALKRLRRRAWQFHIRRSGSKVNETADLFGLDLAGVEQWIREHVKE